MGAEGTAGSKQARGEGLDLSSASQRAAAAIEQRIQRIKRALVARARLADREVQQVHPWNVMTSRGRIGCRLAGQRSRRSRSRGGTAVTARFSALFARAVDGIVAEHRISRSGCSPRWTSCIHASDRCCDRGSEPGLVGADLRNLANEAVLLAARRNEDSIHQKGRAGRA